MAISFEKSLTCLEDISIREILLFSNKKLRQSQSVARLCFFGSWGSLSLTYTPLYVVALSKALALFKDTISCEKADTIRLRQWPDLCQGPPPHWLHLSREGRKKTVNFLDGFDDTKDALHSNTTITTVARHIHNADSSLQCIREWHKIFASISLTHCLVYDCVLHQVLVCSL